MLLSQVVVAAQGGGANIMTFLLPVALIAVFWLLLIRPQRKRQKEMAQLQQQVQPGQKILTGSGLIGTVHALEGDEVLLEVSPGVTVRFVRQSIMRVIEPTEENNSTAEETGDADGDNVTVPETGSDDQADLPPTHDDGRKKD